MKTTKSQSRYREIDIIKGITIIWVVLMHLELNPPIPDAAAQMGIFFLFSGFFFNPINTKALIIKKYNSLIIPLLWFWLISWCVALFKFDVPRYISEQHIDLSHTFGLLTNYSYLRVNILWFLMALFTTHILYNYLFYHIKCYKKELVIILIAIILYLSGSLLTGLKQHEPFHTIYENPWFPIGPFLVYQIYFVIGWYFKKYFLSNFKYWPWLISFIVYSIIFRWIPIPYLLKIVPYTIMLTALLLGIFRSNKISELFSIFEFFGINSIIVYVTHMLIIYSPFCQNIRSSNGPVFGRWLVFAIIVLIEVPIIILINKF